MRVPEEWDAFLQAGSLAEARRRAGAVRPGDVSDIMFTSGTTGRSKGAMTSHERSLGVARAWADCAGLGPGDRYLVVNPFFHTFGFKAGILACLVSGAALVPQAVFDAGEAMRLAEAERITVLPGAPTIYQMILDHPERADRDLSSLRLAVTGAADVPVALVERMRARAELRDRAHRLRADRGGGGHDVPSGRPARGGLRHVGAGRGRVRGEDRPFG